jgi:tRNA threonylcarbamoyl adenosine modification protein YeaZ
MYILGIDSCEGQISVAVNSDQQLLSKAEYGKNRNYMVSIISLIDKALKKAGISLDLVDLFAVNIGPGDFTGTRIGISVAKTLAWVGNKTIFGIGLLDITALGIFVKNIKNIQKSLEERKQVIIAPVLDVKRNEVFFSFYKIKESCLGISGDSQDNHNNEDKHSESKVQVLNITILKKDYLIKKFSGDHLVESKDFVKKFSALIVPDKSFPSYILLSGSAFNSYKYLESEVKKSVDELNLKSYGICPGSSSDSHTSSNLNSLTISIKRGFSPGAFNLNLYAYYSYLKNKQECLEKVKNTGQSELMTPNNDLADFRLAPLYVREFTPFKT